MVPGSNTPIRGSNRPPITGLLLIYVSLDVTSTTEFFLISSGDNILNCMPIIFDGALYLPIFDLDDDMVYI